MRPSLLLIASVLITSPAFAQPSPSPQDIAAIKGQCGCHTVDFKYVETFSPDKAYQFKDRYTAKGVEWVFVDEERGRDAAPPTGKPGKLVIQHLLVASDTMVIKHWREDWTFQNTSLLAFDQNASWKRVNLPVEQAKGQWTQQVFEVDDSPRYEARPPGFMPTGGTTGKAPWMHPCPGANTPNATTTT